MNKLMRIMSENMNISAYTGESEGAYEYRILYSALGLWCLTSALSEKEGKKEISKNAQTILLHSLLDRYLNVCPLAKRFLTGIRNVDIAVQIRNVYEQMGYLVTLEDNQNVLNQGGETIRITDKDSIFLGIPKEEYWMNGLGIHIKNSGREIPLTEYLVRDNLMPEEYLMSCFNICDFDEKDIDCLELEFFNPFYRGKISEAWKKYRNADMTIARKSPIGPFYRAMEDTDGRLVFAIENNNDYIDSKTGADFRRIYIALRGYYLNPMIVYICPIDKEYSHIKILGQIPNREYYYMLLNAWPQKSFTDRNNFIIRNELTTQVISLLTNIGFKAREGEFYG